MLFRAIEVRQNTQARDAGLTKKRYKGLDQALKFISPTLEYQLGHYYSFKTDRHVSIRTLGGRVMLLYTGYSEQVALLQQGARIGTAKLWYGKPRKQFYLLVFLEVERDDPTPESHTRTRIIGVDVGQRYLAVMATLHNVASFFSGKEVRAKADHYVRERKQLQQKGSCDATLRLVSIAGRERRLKADRNHSHQRTKHRHARVAHTARLDEYRRLDKTPRGSVPGYVGP